MVRICQIQCISVDDLYKLQRMIKRHNKIAEPLGVGNPVGGNPKSLGLEHLLHYSSVVSQGSGTIKEYAKEEVGRAHIK